MLLKMFCGEEIHSASVSRRGGEFHFPGHLRVRGFVLHRACCAVSSLPAPHTPRRKLDVAAQRSLIRLGFPREAIHVIAKKLLGHFHVDLSFVLGHQLLPATMPRVGAVSGVARGEGGFLRCQFRIDGEIGSDKVADRKSTRLNSSHLVISYAVFCLKKKKNQPTNTAVVY